MSYKHSGIQKAIRAKARQSLTGESPTVVITGVGHRCAQVFVLVLITVPRQESLDSWSGTIPTAQSERNPKDQNPFILILRIKMKIENQNGKNQESYSRNLLGPVRELLVSGLKFLLLSRGHLRHLEDIYLWKDNRKSYNKCKRVVCIDFILLESGTPFDASLKYRPKRGKDIPNEGYVRVYSGE
eukprot:1196294-Prorocentrum_minimum.AAC.5